MVPCASHFAPSIFLASASKTSINVEPMALRFASGSVTPASLLKNKLPACTPITLRPKSLYESRTSSNSFLRRSPLSTKIHVRFLPIALLSNTAATVLSTPPESPRITLSFPSLARIASTVVSINESGVQLPWQPQMFIAKFSSIFGPSLLWNTSGWNCTAQVSSPSILYAAFSTSSVLAIT